VQIDTAGVNGNPAVAGSWVGPSDPKGSPDQFAAGTALGVTLSTSGIANPGGNMLIEVTVGFGTAGG
jgi:hypothetical protein